MGDGVLKQLSDHFPGLCTTFSPQELAWKSGGHNLLILQQVKPRNTYCVLSVCLGSYAGSPAREAHPRSTVRKQTHSPGRSITALSREQTCMLTIHPSYSFK